MTRQAFRLATAALLSLSAPACAQKSEDARSDGKALPVGAELKICSDCPVFVRVPDAPKGMRAIRFVAKFELTWNNYLAAYDAGRCAIPNPHTGISTKGPNDLLADVESLYIDWPASKLGPVEIQCYIGWLQEKTPYIIALPAAKEWEWFARAGRTNAKFPWGNDPDPNREALCGNTRVERLRIPPATMGASREHMHGVAPGQFPPNDWGLHDIMGSLPEMTSVTISGEDWYRQHPNSKFAERTRDESRAVVKGGSIYFCDWSENGISSQSTVSTVDDHYSFDVAIRLILIKKEAK